jgi:putative membrane protein
MTFVKHVHVGGTFRFGPPGFHPGPGYPFLGLLFFIVIVAVVVWALVVITRYLNHRQPHHDEQGDASGSSEALRILNERFARGEIDADEFTQRRDLLLRSR